MDVPRTKARTTATNPYHLPEELHTLPSGIVDPTCIPLTMGEVADLLNEIHEERRVCDVCDRVIG